MAKKNEPRHADISSMDIAAKKLISTLDPSYKERTLLSKKDSKIQDIINNELELAKGVSKGSIVDFATMMAKESARQNGRNPQEVDGYTMFTENIGDIFGYLQEMYKNRYIELADLKFISKFIPAIGEAIKTTLDAIVSSDDMSDSITRNLEFGPSLSDSEKAQVTAEIERIENDEKLLKKLKNIVYKKTLITGNHYIFCAPYSELFEEYDRLVKNGRIVGNTLVNRAMSNKQNSIQKRKGFNLKSVDKRLFAYESNVGETTVTTENGFSQESLDIIDNAIESLIATDNEFKKNEATIRAEMLNKFENIQIVDSDYLLEAIEGFSSAKFMRENISSYRDVFGGNAIIDEKINSTPEAVLSTTASPEKFSVQGSYIKYIDAAKIVPVKVYEQVIGYLHVHDTTATKKATGMSNIQTNTTNLIASTSNVFSSVNLAEDKRNKAVQTIVDAISDGIITNFSNKFVNKNSDFKKLIADCIIANGLVNNTFQIQFIPAKYIIHFTINEDENGMGQSMLQDALFPAKMLLSTIVAKLLLYMNKSGNKTIAYIRKGPIDVNTSNHVQRTIRMLQESNITFSDLLSTNLSFAKFSRNGNIQMPMAKNGDRLIDFETQEGQEVDMNTPMEEYLEKLAIIGTGVPSVIMEYINSADYAKSIVTANLKFAGRVASFDSDLEEPTTDLYKALLKTSGLDDTLKSKAINTFKFKLNRPKVLSNTNMSDYLSQVDQTTRTLATLLLGENDENPEDAKIRQAVIKDLAMEMLPFLTWDKYDEIVKNAKIKVASEKNYNNNENQNQNDMTTNNDDEFL